jgi:hypothetical protein
MKEKVKRQKAKVGEAPGPMAPVRLLQLAVVFLTFAFFLFPFALASRAHEPITTKVRFNK